jgi:hypothetical protein
MVTFSSALLSVGPGLTHESPDLCHMTGHDREDDGLSSGFLLTNEGPMSYSFSPVLVSTPGPQASAQASGRSPIRGTDATRERGCAQKQVPDSSPQFRELGFEATGAEW